MEMTSLAPENFSGGAKLITIHRKPKNLNFFRISKCSPSLNAIKIVPIVFRFVLEKVLTHVKQVVQSGPAFCSFLLYNVTTLVKPSVGILSKLYRSQQSFHGWNTSQPHTLIIELHQKHIR